MTMTRVEKIIDFLATDTLSLTFTDKGLKFLSLRPNRGAQDINLKGLINEKQEPGSVVEQIINETFSFLETGRHEMSLDFTEFTDFQQRVFGAVGTIEPGQVITYKGIAEILGKPGAAQAVGSAVAKNPVSYFLPTHRVLPQRGIGICRSGAGHLREKLLAHEGHDLSTLRGNYVCTRKKCCLE
ncbi:MAG: methylated-DNA--[protein]-cysteine S-methyltransferase [Peptococcaceae bacterium]|nr:methylated-DNA--[protein]-cysteine S-methyltransferase [Candidatus Syntrophopropionicum ammoniitolerans]